jgi:Cu-Zn family superoxide dismutase
MVAKTVDSKGAVLMKKATWLTVGALICSAAVAGKALGQAAHAELRNDKGEAVGEATLAQTPHGVLLTVDLHGLPAGEHAFHIHAVGKCEPPFTSAGGHFNPAHKQHGIKNPEGMHAGDLPNIYVPESGKLKFDVFATAVTLQEGENSLFDTDGSALVIHAGPDDYKSDPAGDAGARIACGVVMKK